MFINIVIFCICFFIGCFITRWILNMRGRVTIYCEKNRTMFSENEYKKFLKREMLKDKAKKNKKGRRHANN